MLDAPKLRTAIALWADDLGLDLSNLDGDMLIDRIRTALVATPPASRKEQLEKRAAELVADMDAKGIKTLGDVARYCDHAEATPPAVTTPGQFAERVVAACRGYMNTYDVLAKEIRENMQFSMAEALRAADAVTNPATPPAEPVVEAWREIEQHVQPRLADGYTAVAISKPGFWMVKGPGPAAALATKPAVKDEETVVALPPTREYVDRIVRIFRDRPADDTSAVVLQDYARAALAAKDGRHE